MKLEFSRHIFEKLSNLNFMKFCPMGAKLLHNSPFAILRKHLKSARARRLGTLKQSDALLDIGKQWPKKKFHILSTRFNIGL